MMGSFAGCEKGAISYSGRNVMSVCSIQGVLDALLTFCGGSQGGVRKGRWKVLVLPCEIAGENHIKSVTPDKGQIQNRIRSWSCVDAFILRLIQDEGT